MPSVDLDPSAEGFFKDWFNVGGASKTVSVNDANDATGVGTNSAGYYQSFELDDLPADATEVVSVTVKARLQANGASWNGIIHVYVRHGDELILAFSKAVGTVGGTGTTVVEETAIVTKPDGTAWTPAEVNALQAVAFATKNDGFDYTQAGHVRKVWATVVYNDVPPQPTDLSAVLVAGPEVDLAWTDNATNETAYVIERAVGGGDFTTLDTEAASTVTYTDSTVENNTLYRYRVKATNASGSSLYSNIVTVSVGIVAPSQSLFSIDLPNARFEVLQNVRNHGYRSGEQLGLMAIRFSIGAGEVGPVNFNPAAYDDATSLAAAVQVAMRAAGAGDETCTYSNSTHLFTVGKAAGTLSLLIDTGDDAHKAISIWTQVLGFNPAVDKTGSLSYVADNPTFEAADKDHILLCSLDGFIDDASGTYTGTADAVIEKAPDVARVLLERYLGVPESKINVASFEAARTHLRSAVPLFVWIQDREDAGTILERIEAGALSDIVQDTEGTWFYVPYNDTTVRREFFDRDYLSFKARRPKSSVWKGVRVHYGLKPHNGRRDVVELVDEETGVLRDTEELKDLVTYLRDKSDAEDLAEQARTLFTASPIEVEFTSRSKLVDIKLADVIELTRARCAESPTGALDAVRFKVVHITHNFGTGVSFCYCVEQIDL